MFIDAACSSIPIYRQCDLVNLSQSALAGMEKALSEKKPGRKEKGWMQDEAQMQDQVETLRRLVAEYQKNARMTAREKRKKEAEMYTARKVVEWRIEDGSLCGKKNAGLVRILKRLCSGMPTEPPQKASRKGVLPEP